MPSKPADPSHSSNSPTSRRKSRGKSNVLGYETLEPRQLLATFYVSNSGNDSGNGTSLESPFQTIQRAATAARAGDTVLIRGGTYRETVNVPRSGTADNPITFAAYNNEDVVLSGGDLVTGWTRHNGNIWKAANSWDLGTDGSGNTLFVDGDLKFEAREHAETSPLRLSDWGRIGSGALQLNGFSASDARGKGDDFWNGAKVRHHTHDWVVRTSTIKDYDSSSGRIVFETPLASISQKQDFGYYIFDTLKALDRAGEWFKDRSTNTLYYQVENGQNPNNLNIEFKRRGYAFNVKGRDYIKIEGMTFRGASIEANNKSDYNTYAGNTFYAYNKSNVGRLFLNGQHNTFRDNEVSQVWGSALTVSGLRNSMINNYLHEIGYNGTTRVLSMGGAEHLISHNTVSGFARSFVDGIPLRTEFAYNVFEDGGRLSWDTGVFDGDSGRGNGGGSTIHHNIFRNSPTAGIYTAFYSGTDLVVHHNVVHNLGTVTLRAGTLNFLKYYHNTLIGPEPLDNANDTGEPVESNYNNNLQLTTDRIATLGVDNRGNYNYSPADFANFNRKNFRLASDSGAIDAGIVLPGINDDFTGAAPDAGAFEFGQPAWQAGHDFSNPPTPTYGWVPLPGTNIFGNGQFRSPPATWTSIGTPVWFDGNPWNSSRIGLAQSGRVMQLQPSDGITQVFTGLQPNTSYTVGANAKLTNQDIDFEQYDGVSGSVTQERNRQEEYITGLERGEHLWFEGVDFGTEGRYDQLELVYSRLGGSPSTNGNERLQVRLGSPTGRLLGTFNFNPDHAVVWDSTVLDIPSVTGNQTLYFVAAGSQTNLLRLANLRLRHSNPQADDQVTLSVEDHGGNRIQTRIGGPDWLPRYESFTFTTGPTATSAKVTFKNDGPYDAYVDRFAIFEAARESVNVAAEGVATQVSTAGSNVAGNAIDGITTGNGSLTTNTENAWLQVDLGKQQDIHEIWLTSPASNVRTFSNFRVSIFNTDPQDGGHELWGRDYLDGQFVGENETLLIKSTDLNDGGTIQLKDVVGRFVRVQLNGRNAINSGQLGVAEIEVFAFDDLDLVKSDADVRRTTNSWEAAFSQQVNLGQLVLFNTDTADYQNLSDFKVAVWDRPQSDGGRVVWSKDYFGTGSVERGGSFVITADEVGGDGATRLGSVLARAVRVRLNGTNNAGNGTLGLLDASIHSLQDAPARTNFAATGIATQSSNHYGDPDNADIAINNRAFPDGDFTTTRNSANPWWQVELQQTPRIDQIVLFNRDLGAAERIGDFRVSVRNAGGSELWGRNYSFSNGDIPAGGSLSINGSDTSNGLRLDRVTDGKIVRVQLRGSNFLSLSEVQVWGTDSSLRIAPDTTSFTLDMGTAVSPRASALRVTPETNGDVWWTGNVQAADRAGISNAWLRDFVGGTGPAGLHVKIPNGVWNVTINMGDADEAQDQMMLYAQGQAIDANISSTADGTINDRFPRRSFQVQVVNGQLDLRFDDAGGNDFEWALNRVSLNRIGDVSGPIATSVIRDGGSLNGSGLVRPDRFNELKITFDQDVVVQASDLQLFNETTGMTPHSMAGVGFSYDATTYVATWDMSSISTSMAAGFYRYQLNGSSVTGAQTGVAMDSSAVGSVDSGQVYIALPGDTDLDGDVDIIDASGGDGFAFVRNLGVQTGATWAMGDFDGDGDVDIIDASGGDGFTFVRNLGRDVRPVAATSGAQLAALTAQPTALTTTPAASTAQPVARSAPQALDSTSSDVTKSDVISSDVTLNGDQPALAGATTPTEESELQSVSAATPMDKATSQPLALAGAYDLTDEVFGSSQW